MIMCKVWSDNDNAQGVDTCKGDGGSPLTCKIQGRNSWVQVSHPSPSPESHQSLSATNMERSKKSSLKLKFDLIDQCTIVNISQRGIVSWGIGCGEEGVPAVYANVAHVVCWIDDEVTFDTSAVLTTVFLQVKKYFGEEKSSRFGFLPGVDCLGAEPMSDCR